MVLVERLNRVGVLHVFWVYEHDWPHHAVLVQARLPGACGTQRWLGSPHQYICHVQHAHACCQSTWAASSRCRSSSSNWLGASPECLLNKYNEYSPIVICGRPMRQPRDCSVAARARAGARAACFSADSRRCRSFSAVCLLSASCSATSLDQFGMRSSTFPPSCRWSKVVL